VKADTNKTSR